MSDIISTQDPIDDLSAPDLDFDLGPGLECHLTAAWERLRRRRAR